MPDCKAVHETHSLVLFGPTLIKKNKYKCENDIVFLFFFTLISKRKTSDRDSWESFLFSVQIFCADTNF